MSLLKELIGYKKHSSVDIADFLNAGIRDGKIKVRSGNFAFVVIPTDADFVYKVWTHDQGWWEYLEYLNDHPGNEHLLKVKSRIKKIKYTFKRPQDFDTDLYVLKLEKLQELETNDEAFKQIDAFMLYLNYNNVHGLTKDDVPRIQKWILEKHNVQPPPASFIETVIDVLKSSVISDHDFHSGNVMLRGNTLVLTDPYYVPENSMNIKISASDLLYGNFYGKYNRSVTKSGR